MRPAAGMRRGVTRLPPSRETTINRRSFLALCSSALVLAACSAAADAPLTRQVRKLRTLDKVAEPARPEPLSLRIATYNVRFANPNTVGGLDAIETAHADLVCVQEVGPDWRRAMDDRLARSFPFRRYVGEPARGGLAFLSRYPIVEVVAHPGLEGGYGFAVAEVLVDGANLKVLNIHLRPAHQFERAHPAREPQRVREMAAVLSEVDTGVPTLLVGDLSSLPASDPIVLAATAGLASTHEGRSHQPTWAPRGGGFVPKLRHDYIMHTPHFQVRTEEVVLFGGSDHYPLVADLMWVGRTRATTS